MTDMEYVLVVRSPSKRILIRGMSTGARFTSDYTGVVAIDFHGTVTDRREDDQQVPQVTDVGLSPDDTVRVAMDNMNGRIAQLEVAVQRALASLGPAGYVTPVFSLDNARRELEQTLEP